MCIIFQRDAEVAIDKEAFLTAFDNNPDGYGIAYANGDGTCTMLKGLDMDGEDLFKLIDEDLYEHKMMIHLRYTTAGATSRRNLHPFPILEAEADGVDVWMCHNGTLSDYKHAWNHPREWESDTRNFVRTYVRPLFKRLIKGMTSEEIFSDKWVYELLDEKLSAMSVITFIDGYGNTLEVNALGNGGKYEEGLYYSNEYSFDPLHRNPRSATGTSVTRHSGGQSYGYHDFDNYNDWWDDELKNKENKEEKKGHAMDTQVTTFTDQWGIDPDDIYQMNDDTIEYLKDEEPAMMVSLLKELLVRCFDAEQEVAKLNTKKDKAEKKIAELMSESKEKAVG